MTGGEPGDQLGPQPLVGTQRLPGATLLHPLSLLCLLVLVANDHVLKRACPGFVTGKLSDVSGLFLLPLFLHALFELGYARYYGRTCSPQLARRTLALCAWFSALGFALVELGGLGDVAFRFGLAALQWPFRALFALVREETLPALAPVRATADLGDLAALPMAWLAHVIGARAFRSPAAQARAWSRFARRRAISSLAAGLVVTVGVSSVAAAVEPRGVHTHDGFYLGFDLGAGVAWLDSDASISNGFRQAIPSTARGLAFPTGALELGGTLPGIGLVLGARLGMTNIVAPVIHTLGESFEIPNSSFWLVELQAIAKLYPDPRRGLHFGVGAGGMSIERESEFAGEQQRGFCLFLEGGHDFWIARQWSLGVEGRLTVGRVNGDDFGHTTVVLPALLGTVAFH